MTSFQIDIRDEAPKYRISIPRLKKIAKQILKALGWKKAGLSVLLVTDQKIRPINRQYLNHDRPTDVISFGQGPKSSGSFLGDLVISLDTTARQAKEYGNSFDYELCFYLSHGILHLMGYKDKTKKDAARMDRKQKAILRKIGIK